MFSMGDESMEYYEKARMEVVEMSGEIIITSCTRDCDTLMPEL